MREQHSFREHFNAERPRDLAIFLRSLPWVFLALILLEGVGLFCGVFAADLVLMAAGIISVLSLGYTLRLLWRQDPCRPTPAEEDQRPRAEHAALTPIATPLLSQESDLFENDSDEEVDWSPAMSLDLERSRHRNLGPARMARAPGKDHAWRPLQYGGEIGDLASIPANVTICLEDLVPTPECRQEDWFAVTDPKWLARFGPWQQVSSRKKRLFGCACCRRIWDQLTDARSRTAVEVTEAHADGLVSTAEWEMARRAAKDAAARLQPRPGKPRSPDMVAPFILDRAAAAATAASHFMDEFPFDQPFQAASLVQKVKAWSRVLHTDKEWSRPIERTPDLWSMFTDPSEIELVAGGHLDLDDRLRPILTDLSGAEWPVEYSDELDILLDDSSEFVLALDEEEYPEPDSLPRLLTEERRQQASILRDIIGNPFRPVHLDPAWLRWNGGMIRTIARTIYDERRFEDMPVLADALEDAGCDDPYLLSHCRSKGPHVRGCFLLDLLLGKE
jgi:hypothetical protein